MRASSPARVAMASLTTSQDSTRPAVRPAIVAIQDRMILAAVDGAISARTRSGMPRDHTSVVPRSSMALSRANRRVASAPVKFQAPGMASTTSIFMSFIATVMAQSRAMIRPRRGEDATLAASMPAPKAMPLTPDTARSEGGPAPSFGAGAAAAKAGRAISAAAPSAAAPPTTSRRLGADAAQPRPAASLTEGRSAHISIPLARKAASARSGVLLEGETRFAEGRGPPQGLAPEQQAQARPSTMPTRSPPGSSS